MVITELSLCISFSRLLKGRTLIATITTTHSTNHCNEWGGEEACFGVRAQDATINTRDFYNLRNYIYTGMVYSGGYSKGRAYLLLLA